MRTFILVVATLLLVSAVLEAQQARDTTPQPPAVPAAAPELPPRAVVTLDSATARDRVAERVRSGRNKGIVVALVDDAGIRYLSEGVMDDATGTPVSHSTLFEIGSVTKVLTALLLAEMMHRHELRLENPAAMYLPDTVRPPGMGGDSITLLHLVTHTSGLPRLPLNLNVTDLRNPYMRYAPEHLYAFLSNYQLQRAPGERYEYSNLGAGLLAHLLSIRGGTTYQALLLERVLRPLGMRESMITLGPSMRERFAEGHDATGAPTPAWEFDVLAGAGAVRSTAADLALLLRAALDARTTDDDRPIMRALRTSMEPHMVIDQGRASMGLGWHIVERGGHRLIMHNGRTGGFASFVGFDPERGVGVVLLTNSSAPVDDIALALLTAN